MMKNRLGLVTAWLLATALAVGVASQAVGLVADRAVELPAQINIAVAGQSSFGPITAPPSDPSTPTTIRSTTTTSSTAPAPTTSTTPTTSSGVTTSTGATATTTTTATTSPPPSTTTTTSAPLLDSQTFFPTGGQVSVACTGPDTIKYLAAVPASGWTLHREDSGPVKVRVEFESGEQESEIEIVCINSQLIAEMSD